MAVGIKQAEKFGASFVKGKAARIEAVDGGLSVKLEDGTSYEAKHVILATASP